MSEDNKKSNESSSNGKQSETPECFVIMPISDPDGYEAGHFRRVYEDLFIPACANNGYKAIRADEVRQTNLIHLDVLQKIVGSPMALCDLSSRNPNVLFELGLRQAFDKPVVLVQEVGTPAIFDINPLRYANYRREMLYRQVIEDQAEITEAIKETKEAIGDSKSINSIVKLLSLTHGASLTAISESEKEPALLQVIMAELSNLRSEVRTLQPRRIDGRATVIESPPSWFGLHVEVERLRRDMRIVEAFLSEAEDLRQYSQELDDFIKETEPRVNQAIAEAPDSSLASGLYAYLINAKKRLIKAALLNNSLKRTIENAQQG